MTRAAAIVALVAACAPAPAPTSAARASVEVPLVATLDLEAPDAPRMIGRPWARQRAALTLGAEASLEVDTESGVRDVRCPEELRGTSTQGCESEAAARALEARVDRVREVWRGASATEGDALTLTLREGTRALSLRCRRVDAGVDCQTPSGWPSREGFRAPAALSFRRQP